MSKSFMSYALHRSWVIGFLLKCNLLTFMCPCICAYVPFMLLHMCLNPEKVCLSGSSVGRSQVLEDVPLDKCTINLQHTNLYFRFRRKTASMGHFKRFKSPQSYFDVFVFILLLLFVCYINKCKCLFICSNDCF